MISPRLYQTEAIAACLKERERGLTRCLVSKDASWRGQEASDRQIELLRRWNIPYSSGISKGEASALSDLEVARREAARMEPATAKQIWFIRNRLHIEVPRDTTKGEASRIISDAKRERSAA
jgi:hypothetical protein